MIGTTKPKILFVLRNSWNNNISIGNTLSNVFSGWNGDIATLYCRNEKINNTICKKYFRITERDIVKNFTHPSKIGNNIIVGDNNIIASPDEEKIISKENNFYNKARKHRFTILLWFRELIWVIGLWKNEKLNNFIDSFNPDIVFIPLYDTFYTYKIADYVIKRTNARILTYTGDDLYDFGKEHYSPLYYIDMLFRRYYIKNFINRASLRVCLTKEQADTYQALFKKFFFVMKKGVVCDVIPSTKDHKYPLQLVYTGNISLGRDETLIEIIKQLDVINRDKLLAQLNIYSGNEPTKHFLSITNTSKSAIFHGNIPASQVVSVQKNADILLHVESFVKMYKDRVKCSLSTKIVDYLACKKCILAVGPSGISSIEYLRRNDAAYVIDNLHELYDRMFALINNSLLIKRVEEKAWNFVSKEHNIKRTQKEMYDQILSLNR